VRSTFDIGFLGGGQLARMSIQAAQRMGLTCLSLDPGEVTPASQIAEAVRGTLADPDKIAEIFSRCERVTLENEFIPAAAVREAARRACRSEDAIVPGIDTLGTIQDKLLQRQALLAAGVPSPRAIPMKDVDEAVAEIGLPMVLKARFGGYDGKGTRTARTREEVESFRDLWEDGTWLAEEFVPFRRELAVMVYVGPQSSGCFPTMETVQKHHVCDLVYPCDTDGSSVATAAVRAVEGRGLFGVELFELPGGAIMVNEIAPRPHNTGHYTLDWGGVSQFEQHVRLTVGLPLAVPQGAPACMANLMGQDGARDWREGLRAALEDECVHVHWYGKAESRRGRKMGHLNVVGAPDLVVRAAAAQSRFYDAWTRG
jgi:5-(carboxyamino)imidazole ribonucleotide synthase